MRAVLLLVLALPVSAQAALPSNYSLGRVIPTPSGIVDSRYPDGDDGTTAIPLLWGTCPSLATTTADSDAFNLRTLCALVEAGSPTATLSLLSGTLPSGCIMATNGIDCTTPTAGSASVTVRATRNTDTADTGVSITVTTAGTDSTAPTIPLGLTAVDNADGTGSLTWDAASDPSVSGIATGVASYRVQKSGVTQATVTAPSANVQPALTETRIGSADSEASSQSGADWTMTFGGAGLVAGGDHVLGRLAQVTGDFVATAKIAAYTPSAGTTGSIGIAARASTSANVIAAYARWKDSDDQCNLRYRWQAGSMSNGSDSAATYSTLPVWIRMSRSGDTFSAACSSDGNTWVTTSSHTISPGATAYVGPFITSGTASTTTATGTVAQFNVHQGAQVSHPISESGSYTVSSYDGTNRSSESAAVTAAITGGVETPLVTVPTEPTDPGGVAVTVCLEGCDYTPDKLRTALAQSSSALKVTPGSIIELRSSPAGSLAEWKAVNQWFDCDGVSGTAADPIWLVVREGDAILLDSATNGSTGLIDMSSCNYWNIVGSRDGGSGALLIADRDHHKVPGIHDNPGLYDLYNNGNAVNIRSSTGVALVGLTVSGARTFVASTIDGASSRVLLKYADIGRHGSNAYDLDKSGAVAITPGSLSFDGDTDSGEIMTFLPSKSVLDHVTVHHSGHTQLQYVGPHQVVRNSDFSGDWSDITNYPQYTGNHQGSTLPQRLNWGSSTFFGPLVENTVFRGVGSEPEHKLMNESIQLLAFNAIFRSNFAVQRAGPDGYWGRFGPVWINSCSSFGAVTTTDLAAYVQIYNNTLWGGAVLDASGLLPAATYTAPSCGHWNVRNNLFQGVQTHMKRGSKSLTSYSHTVDWSTNGLNTGHANAWKSAVWTGNVFGVHPADPPSSTYYRVYLGSKSGGSGTGSALLTDSTTWPSNWYDNSDVQVTWASGTTTALANFVADPILSATAIRAALVPAAASNAVVRTTAKPMTTVATADACDGGGSCTTTLVLNSARWIYDGWDIDEYTWGGLHQEYADCIAVGPAADSTVDEAVVVGVSEATDIVYTTGTVTIDSAVTRVDGSPVWPATRNSNGTCGAAWADKGAAQ